MYADAHSGVLNLDTDQVVGLIGGWQDNFYQTLKAARLLAISMADTHLRACHDVVMPQLATRTEEVEGFEAAAARAGARYREIVLMADKQQTLSQLLANIWRVRPCETVPEPTAGLRGFPD